MLRRHVFPPRSSARTVWNRSERRGLPGLLRLLAYESPFEVCGFWMRLGNVSGCFSRGVFEGEAFVATVNYVCADFAVAGCPAEVDHAYSGFAGNIGAHVPGVGFGHERRGGHLVAVCHPSVFGLGRRLDGFE